MRIATLPAALAASLLAAAPVAAQSVTQPDQEQQQHAVEYFNVLVAGLRSDQIEEPIKSALMGCIYGNSLKTISEAIDKAIDSSEGQVDRTDANAVLTVMVGVCGYRPQAPATPPTDGTTPQGR